MTSFRTAIVIAAALTISSPVYAGDAKCSMLTEANDPTGGLCAT